VNEATYQDTMPGYLSSALRKYTGKAVAADIGIRDVAEAFVRKLNVPHGFPVDLLNLKKVIEAKTLSNAQTLSKRFDTITSQCGPELALELRQIVGQLLTASAVMRGGTPQNMDTLSADLAAAATSAPLGAAAGVSSEDETVQTVPAKRRRGGRAKKPEWDLPGRTSRLSANSKDAGAKLNEVLALGREFTDNMPPTHKPTSGLRSFMQQQHDPIVQCLQGCFQGNVDAFLGVHANANTGGLTTSNFRARCDQPCLARDVARVEHV
jgi:hypothetical protein